MIFLWIIPAFAGLANYVIPLQLGANDMAFPKLNALSFWLLIPGAILLLVGFWVGGAESGWTAYPPLSLQTGSGQTIWAIALQFIGFSSIFGAINFLVTIFNMRAPGHDADADAADGLGDHRHLDHHHPGHAGALGRAGDADGQPHPGRQLLRSHGRRRPADVAEPLLVLLAPGRLHHDPARLRHHLRGAAGLLPQADLRLQADRVLQPGHRHLRLPGVGAPHVHQRHGSVPARPVHDHLDDHRRADRASRSSAGWRPSGAASCASPRP